MRESSIIFGSNWFSQQCRKSPLDFEQEAEIAVISVQVRIFTGFSPLSRYDVSLLIFNSRLSEKNSKHSMSRFSRHQIDERVLAMFDEPLSITSSDSRRVLTKIYSENKGCKMSGTWIWVMSCTFLSAAGTSLKFHALTRLNLFLGFLKNFLSGNVENIPLAMKFVCFPDCTCRQWP